MEQGAFAFCELWGGWVAMDDEQTKRTGKWSPFIYFSRHEVIFSDM